MYRITDAFDVLGDGGVLVFVPYATSRKAGVPSVPDELSLLIPNARKTFEKINETSDGGRDTFYYLGNGNTYIFHRVKSSTKANEVSMDMLNKGIDILEQEFPLNNTVLIVGTGEEEADSYLKLLFKGNSSVFFLERQF